MQNTDCQLFGDSVEEELLLNGKGSTQEQRDDLLKLYGLLNGKTSILLPCLEVRNNGLLLPYQIG